ncbi:MAG: FAD-dependent oxidoreductase [Pirellulales bacterium]
MKPEPIWQSTRPKRATKIKNSARYDVAIVGGGLTGLTAAYLLKRAGKKVCLLERDRLASGDTVLTTAHLTYVTDVRVSNLAKNFGDEAAGAGLGSGRRSDRFDRVDRYGIES